MSAEVKEEIGHVLFIDIVDYSKLSINEQHAAVKELNQIVRASRHPIRDFINFTILIIRICACLRLLNVFIPPAPLLMILGIVKGAIDYSQKHHLGGLSITMTLTGIQTLFIGLLAELTDQRMKL